MFSLLQFAMKVAALALLIAAAANDLREHEIDRDVHQEVSVNASNLKSIEGRVQHAKTQLSHFRPRAASGKSSRPPVPQAAIQPRAGPGRINGVESLYHTYNLPEPQAALQPRAGPGNPQEHSSLASGSQTASVLDYSKKEENSAPYFLVPPAAFGLSRPRMPPRLQDIFNAPLLT